MHTLTMAVAVVTAVSIGTGTPAPPPIPQGQARTHTVTLPPDPDAEPYVSVFDASETAPDPRATTKPRAKSPAAARRSGGELSKCTSSAAQPVRDGEPIVVSMPPAKPFTVGKLGPSFWAKPPHTDPTWQMYLYSFRWMPALVKRAIEDDQVEAKNALLDEVVRFYRDNPDRGLSVRGWDEGSSLRRLEYLNCLYALTGDARLVPGMKAEVALQFGPRYYGPPRHPVHNHGLMANLRVVEAGRLLGQPAWIAKAGARIQAEAGLAFSRLGTSWEQSSAYQPINRNMWSAAADVLASLDAENPVVAAIRRTTRRADNVTQWLTEPDGRIVQIGDAQLVPGIPQPKRTDPGVFRDDPAGLAVGRWSWKDADTSYYTLRYGPPRRAHGHPDKTSVTWSVAGSRVLVGSGFFGYDTLSPYVQYQKTPQAANVAIPVGGKARNAPAAVTRMGITRAAHRWVMTDRTFGRSHARTVDVHHGRKMLTVWDGFGGRVAADQVWHLDPQWQLVSAPRHAKLLRFKRPDGRILEIRTTGWAASVVRGATRPVAGWNFEAPGKRTPNWELRLRWTSGTVKTTFQVR